MKARGFHGGENEGEMLAHQPAGAQGHPSGIGLAVAGRHAEGTIRAFGRLAGRSRRGLQRPNVILSPLAGGAQYRGSVQCSVLEVFIPLMATFAQSETPVIFRADTDDEEAHGQQQH